MMHVPAVYVGSDNLILVHCVNMIGVRLDIIVKI